MGQLEIAKPPHASSCLHVLLHAVPSAGMPTVLSLSTMLHYHLI